MRRLPRPVFDPWAATTLATAKFVGAPLSHRVLAAEAALKEAYTQFEVANDACSWHSLIACNHGEGGQVIVGGLTKDELRSLYSEGIVKGVPEARDIYDQIKVGARGKCPYCAGIGDVDPLDHYLPKSRYPQYSVVPSNLIPSCDRCNKLSGSNVVTEYRSQTLNPYFDHERFFIEPWVHVAFEADDITSYMYFCDPPIGWHDDDKMRVRKHFENFRLAERYAATASAEVGYLINDLPGLLAGLNDPLSVQAYLVSKANSNSFVLNGWERPLYRALSQADWYLDSY